MSEELFNATNHIKRKIGTTEQVFVMRNVKLTDLKSYGNWLIGELKIEMPVSIKFIGAEQVIPDGITQTSELLGLPYDLFFSVQIEEMIFDIDTLKQTILVKEKYRLEWLEDIVVANPVWWDDPLYSEDICKRANTYIMEEAKESIQEKYQGILGNLPPEIKTNKMSLAKHFVVSQTLPIYAEALEKDHLDDLIEINNFLIRCGRINFELSMDIDLNSSESFYLLLKAIENGETIIKGHPKQNPKISNLKNQIYDILNNLDPLGDKEPLELANELLNNEELMDNMVANDSVTTEELYDGLVNSLKESTEDGQNGPDIETIKLNLYHYRLNAFAFNLRNREFIKDPVFTDIQSKLSIEIDSFNNWLRK